MNAPAPSSELVDTLARAEAALASGDMDAASGAMESAADLCRRLQTAGLGVPASELNVLRDLADRCGLALIRLGRDLQSDSLRGDNHRRGIASYQSTLGR